MPCTLPNALELQQLCGRLDRGEITPGEFMAQCTRLIATTVGCTRAGIWMFEGEPSAPRLVCLSLYDALRDGPDPMPDETGEEARAYLEALLQVGHFVAADVHTHPLTRGRFAQQLQARDVRSLMSAACSVNGRLFGAFSCSHVGRRMDWTPPQLTALMRIGSRASLTLARAGVARLDPPPPRD